MKRYSGLKILMLGVLLSGCVNPIDEITPIELLSNAIDASEEVPETSVNKQLQVFLKADADLCEQIDCSIKQFRTDKYLVNLAWKEDIFMLHLNEYLVLKEWNDELIILEKKP